MSNAHIWNLIGQGEGQELDFKYFISNAAKIAKTLAAFANASGGRLLIGVKDNGNIVGIESDEEVYMIELAAERYCRPEVKLEMKSWDMDGHIVLEVYVPPGDERPYHAKDEDGKWTVYIRKNDQNLIAHRVQVAVFKKENNEKANIIRYDKPEKALMDYLAANGKITFNQFCRFAKIRPYIAERILANLVSIHIIAIRHTSQGDYFTAE